MIPQFYLLLLCDPNPSTDMEILWQNNNGDTIRWINDSGQTITWTAN